MKVAHVFPGQGVQCVGMGRDLCKQYSSAKAVFEQADEALGFSLSRLCFEGPEDELQQTINTQPALVATSLACLEATRDALGDHELLHPTLVAGHSLGEYTALAASEVLDFATIVYLARERGRLMHEAGMRKRGGMVAVIGLAEGVLIEVCSQTDTRIANFNCPGQLIISGAEENLDRAAELAQAMGAKRTIPLQVSGAFHTSLMQSAVEGMAETMASLSFQDPVVPVVANTTAEPLTTGESIKEELLRQLCNCVHWQRSVEYMLGNGISTFIEIGPGRVLSGLIKRIHKEAQTLSIGDVSAIKEIASGKI